jgi:hypothetical protein
MDADESKLTASGNVSVPGRQKKVRVYHEYDDQKSRMCHYYNNTAGIGGSVGDWAACCRQGNFKTSGEGTVPKADGKGICEGTQSISDRTGVS